jgi:hypothetical protein
MKAYDTEGFGSHGITRCLWHGNRMPCAACGESLIKVTGEQCGTCGSYIDGALCECTYSDE